jgi:hypothetical protein
MKNIFKTILIFITALSCKAQTPIFDIEDLNNITKDIYGAYYKDTHNQLNSYEGIYIYNQAGKYLKIVLQKKVMSNMNNYYYEDLIIGEFQYIENGVQKANTLDKLLNNNYIDKSLHSISGRMILTGKELGCNDCAPTEKRLACGIVDDKSPSTGDVHIRRVTVNGQAAIKIFVGWQTTAKKPTDAPKIPASIGGYYTLIKQ